MPETETFFVYENLYMVFNLVHKSIKNFTTLNQKNLNKIGWVKLKISFTKTYHCFRDALILTETYKKIRFESIYCMNSVKNKSYTLKLKMLYVM